MLKVVLSKSLAISVVLRFLRWLSLMARSEKFAPAIKESISPKVGTTIEGDTEVKRNNAIYQIFQMIQCPSCNKEMDKLDNGNYTCMKCKLLWDSEKYEWICWLIPAFPRKVNYPLPFPSEVYSPGIDFARAENGEIL